MDFNLRLLDRQGRLLRVVSPEANLQTRRSLDQISPYLVQATLASEDRRFFSHPGIDPLAIGRAARHNWRAGRIVEGGSTLTQQLVRRLRPASDRGWKTKVGESYWALRLERSHSKREILEAYLNLAPYGMQTYGIEAASQLYFNKPASQLSLAESSFLAVLPRAPEAFLPYQNPEEIERYQKLLLSRMQGLGMISSDEVRRALEEPVALRPLDSTFEAGHFCDYVLTQLPAGQRGDVKTTLDLELQHAVEGILKVHLKRLHSRGVGNGAVVVLDVQSGEVLAMAGSIDYRQGQFNACLSGRQAGSTLKPFTYALALERGLTASSILPDLNLYPVQRDQSFIPRNYDERFHGPVRLREALACSYNVPAVRVLERVGVETLLLRLRRLGFSRLKESAQHYGLGLTLGVGEVSLLELARGYRCLARQGRYGQEKSWLDQPEGPQSTLIEPAVAALITDILKDPHARAPAFGLFGPLRFAHECAAKTGTSKGYRDNWTVGYTPLYVVACWVGNFDGTSMRTGVSGITGAAPIFHDVVNTLVQRDTGSPAFTRPSGLVSLEVCEASGDLPGPDCNHRIQEWYLGNNPPRQKCTMHVRFQGKLYCRYPALYRSWALSQGIPQPPPEQADRGAAGVTITYPDNGAVFRLDDQLRREYQSVHFRVSVPDWCNQVEWQVGEHKQISRQRPFDLWWPLQAGGFVVKATARGSSGQCESSSSIRLLVR